MLRWINWRCWPRLSPKPKSRLSAALIRFAGTQCGICTPGIAVCAVHVLENEKNPSRERLRELLSGNICRCTGYQLIVDAIADAAERIAPGGSDTQEGRAG